MVLPRNDGFKAGDKVIVRNWCEIEKEGVVIDKGTFDANPTYIQVEFDQGYTNFYPEERLEHVTKE